MAAKKSKIVKVVKWLEVELLVEELAERGHDAAQLTTKRKSVEAQAKAQAKTYREEVDTLQVNIDTLMECLETRVERREVDCEAIYDYGAASVVITRTDTGAIEEEREMNAAERQMEIEEVKRWFNQQLEDDREAGGGEN